MRIVFFGSTNFSLEILKKLIKNHFVCCVYTQPPRRSGRGKKLNFCPVLKFVLDNGITHETPENFRDEKTIVRFSSLRPDIAIVIAYGIILPKKIISAPKYGCFNFHASLLPRWRGAAPIQRAILANDKKTGMCIIKMNEMLDSGQIVMKKECNIDNNDTFGSLEIKLLEISKVLLDDFLINLNNLTFLDQPSFGVIYAKKIIKSETRVFWSSTVDNVNLKIRAFSPHPGAWFEIDNERIKILSCKIFSEFSIPGQILDDSFKISCSDGSIQPKIIQRAGRQKMDLKTFLRGFKFSKGKILS